MQTKDINLQVIVSDREFIKWSSKDSGYGLPIIKKKKNDINLCGS